MTKRRWRKMTWVVVAWSGLLLVLTLVQMAMVVTKSCSEFSFDSTCINIEAHGRAGWTIEWLIRGIIVWIIGFIPLAVIWFMTRQQARTCPHCGVNVATGLTACANCGYDFTLGGNPAPDSTAAASLASVAPVATSVAAAPGPVASMPREGWYDDAERPGRKRWWSGTAWGMRDDDHPSRASVAPPADSEGAAQRAPQLDSEPGNEVEIAAAPAGSPLQAELEPVVVATAVQPASEPVPATSSPPELAADGAQAARFCENCGAERRPGAQFCSSCGHAH
jgi:zinc-ribbon domain